MVTTRNTISRKIIENLRENSEKILSKEDIINEIKEYSRIYKKKVNILSLWTYFRKAKYIKRVLENFYYIYSLEERYDNFCNFSEEELFFLVLEKMDIKWYLGLESALKENKIIWQSLNVLVIINNHFSGIKKLSNSKFKFIKTKGNKFKLGLIKKKTNHGVTYYYSDLEKTYLDFLYFALFEKKDIKAIKENLDFNTVKSKVIKYVKYYPNKIQEVI